MKWRSSHGCLWTLLVSSRKKGRVWMTQSAETISTLDTEISSRGQHCIRWRIFTLLCFRRIGEMVVSFCKNFSPCEIYVIKPILNALALEKENQWDDWQFLETTQQWSLPPMNCSFTNNFSGARRAVWKCFSHRRMSFKTGVSALKPTAAASQ